MNWFAVILAIVVAAFVVAAFVVAAALAVDWHGMVCDVGHYETVHVPESQTPYIMWVGDVPIMQHITTPAHDKQRWVCDHPKGSK